MAYTINYDQGSRPKYNIPVKFKLNLKFIATVLCIAAILLVWIITPVRVAVLEFLLPGDGAITRQAAGNMLEDLKQGQPFKEAFTDFCIEIIKNA